MANPSPAAIAAIRAHVTDWAPSNTAIVASLNAPAVANPSPQDTVPAPMVAATMMTAIASVSLAKVYSRPAIVAFEQSIRDQNRASATNWIGMALAAADITQADYSALLAQVNATELDPDWPAQISWAQANLGRPVDLDDIITSRP